MWKGRTQFRQVCKINIQGLGYLFPPLKGGGEAVRFPLLFQKHKYILVAIGKSCLSKNSRHNHSNITKSKSRNQENNLLYFICLHHSEVATSRNPTIHWQDLFMFDLDNRLIFIPSFIYGVMGSGRLSNLSKVTSWSPGLYRPGFQLILLSPRLAFFILSPSCLLNKAQF